MSKYTEELQGIFDKFSTAHPEFADSGAVDPNKVAEWAIAEHLWIPRHRDLQDQLAEDLARAWREQFATDEHGRRYRKKHAVRISAGGKQRSLWADIETAPREHMLRAFAQRRQQVVGDCVQLKIDVDVYNDKRSPDAPIQVVLDFTNDVDEDRRARTRRLPLAA